MGFYKKFISQFGYIADGNEPDTYGVKHGKFSTRDELEYQFSRQERENQMAENLKQQGIEPEDYPQLGTAFWGNNPENNYGFGESDIAENIKNVTSNPLFNKSQCPNLASKMQFSSPAPWAKNISDFYSAFSNNTRQLSTYDMPVPYRFKKSADEYKNNVIEQNLNEQNLIEPEEPLQVSSADDLLDRMVPVIREMEKPIYHIYIDTTWHKTTGAGTNVNDWDTFNSINWTTNGRQATPEEKLEAFNKFQNEINLGKMHKDINGNIIKNDKSARFYSGYSPLTITESEIDRLIRNHLIKDIAYLRKEFPDFDTYPPELQNVMLDIKYNTGNLSSAKWPKLREAIKNKDLFSDKGIVNNVNRGDVGFHRNSWAKKQIQSIKHW